MRRAFADFIENKVKEQTKEISSKAQDLEKQRQKFLLLTDGILLFADEEKSV